MALADPPLVSRADPHWDMFLWSTFFEGTAKIHMLVLIPVKARNIIEVTSTRETTKTRAATTPSNSLKLSFTWGPIQQRRGRYGMKIKTTEIDRGFLKSPRYGRFRMPQFIRLDMATGELTHWASSGFGVTGDRW